MNAIAHQGQPPQLATTFAPHRKLTASGNELNAEISVLVRMAFLK